MGIYKRSILREYEKKSVLMLQALIFLFFYFTTIAGNNLKGVQNVILLNTKQQLPVVVVRGKVTDQEGKSLEGATVILRERAKYVLTDSKGEFVITALNKENLEFSVSGFASKVVKVSDKVLNVRLKKI